MAGDNAFFSAGDPINTPGADAVDALITVTAPQTVGAFTVEEGKVAISGAAASITVCAGPGRVNQGATLQISNLNQVSATAGHILTLNGGTLRNTIVGAGSGIYTNPATNAGRIELTANGGTLDTPNGGYASQMDNVNGAFSIMVYGGFIGLAPGETTATLRKTGHGEFRGLSNWNFTTLDVQQGLYRINGTGGSDTGFGAVTGTVMAAGGAVANTSNGTALGTSIGMTGANASPATRSFVLTGVGDTPDTMIVLNASWTINGNISGAGGLMLGGWARNDAGGVPNISGSQTQTLLLGGTNTYAGKTTVNFGTLAATGGNAIPNTSRVEFSTQSLWGVAAAPVANQRTFDTAVFRADASETVGSLAGGNSVRGSVNINGAAVTLTTGADDSTSTYSGAIIGTGGLSKSGTGTFTMDGSKTYTGDTKVLGGTLSTNSASLADLADVYLTTGNFLNLNFAATDTIDSLFIDGVAQAVGIWGGTGSGAANISPLITGTGLLSVTTLPGPVGVQGDYNNNGVVDAADYVVWANGGPLQNEVSGVTPGTVTAEDYDAWLPRFGNNSGSGSSQTRRPRANQHRPRTRRSDRPDPKQPPQPIVLISLREMISKTYRGPLPQKQRTTFFCFLPMSPVPAPVQAQSSPHPPLVIPAQAGIQS